MDIIQKTFKIVSEHLELKDNWGNNPYMSKEKLGEKHGESLALSKLSVAHSRFFDEAKKDAELKDTDIESTSRYLKWLESFRKKDEPNV
jgi:hypothetical protein